MTTHVPLSAAASIVSDVGGFQPYVSPQSPTVCRCDDCEPCLRREIRRLRDQARTLQDTVTRLQRANEARDHGPVRAPRDYEIDPRRLA